MTETILTLSGIGFPPFSARGCQQSLELIQQPQVRRTVNGKLVNVTNPLFQKYRTVIEGSDKQAITFDALKMGQIVTVGCMQYLWQLVTNPHIQLGRPPVEGSIVVVTAARDPLPFTIPSPQEIQVQGEITDKTYVGYCPQLEMRVVDFQLHTNEWKTETKWKLVLEEV